MGVMLLLAIDVCISTIRLRLICETDLNSLHGGLQSWRTSRDDREMKREGWRETEQEWERNREAYFKRHLGNINIVV